jgi:hypothetical protein
MIPNLLPLFQAISRGVGSIPDAGRRSLNDLKRPQRHEPVQKHPARWRPIAANGLHKLYFHLSLVIIFAVRVMCVAVNFEIMRGR